MAKCTGALYGNMAPIFQSSNKKALRKDSLFILKLSIN